MGTSVGEQPWSFSNTKAILPPSYLPEHLNTNINLSI